MSNECSYCGTAVEVDDEYICQCGEYLCEDCADIQGCQFCDKHFCGDYCKALMCETCENNTCFECAYYCKGCLRVLCQDCEVNHKH